MVNNPIRKWKHLRVKVTRRQQATIPEEVRKGAGIRFGDIVDVKREDGRVSL